jgi:hypothetical protein
VAAQIIPANRALNNHPKVNKPTTAELSVR